MDAVRPDEELERHHVDGDVEHGSVAEKRLHNGIADKADIAENKEEAVGSGPVSRHAQELRQKEAQRNQHKIAAGRDKRELQDLHIGEGMLALQNGRENEHRIRDVDEQPGQMTVGVLVHGANPHFVRKYCVQADRPSA